MKASIPRRDRSRTRISDARSEKVSGYLLGRCINSRLQPLSSQNPIVLHRCGKQDGKELVAHTANGMLAMLFLTVFSCTEDRLITDGMQGRRFDTARRFCLRQPRLRVSNDLNC